MSDLSQQLSRVPSSSKFISRKQNLKFAESQFPFSDITHTVLVLYIVIIIVAHYKSFFVVATSAYNLHALQQEFMQKRLFVHSLTAGHVNRRQMCFGHTFSIK